MGEVGKHEGLLRSLEASPEVGRTIPERQRPSPRSRPVARSTGTMTFLFTDVEQNTQRWDMDAAATDGLAGLARQANRQVVDGEDGYVSTTMGGGFAVAFQRARRGIVGGGSTAVVHRPGVGVIRCRQRVLVELASIQPRRSLRLSGASTDRGRAGAFCRGSCQYDQSPPRLLLPPVSCSSVLRLHPKWLVDFRSRSRLPSVAT